MTDVIAVPALSGAIGYLGSKMILGNTGNVSLGSVNLDKNIAMAILIGSSAGIAQISKDFIIPKIPVGSPTLKNVVQNSVGPILCGASTVGLEKILLAQESGSITTLLGGTSNQQGSFMNFAVGAGSYAVSDYLWKMYGK